MSTLTYLTIAGTGSSSQVAAYLPDDAVLVASATEGSRFVVIYELVDCAITYGEYLVDRLASGLYGARHHASLQLAVDNAHDRLPNTPLLKLSTRELPPTSSQLATIDYLANRIEREVATPSSRADAAALIITLRSRVRELVADGTIPA